MYNESESYQLRNERSKNNSGMSSFIETLVVTQLPIPLTFLAIIASNRFLKIKKPIVEFFLVFAIAVLPLILLITALSSCVTIVSLTLLLLFLVVFYKRGRREMRIEANKLPLTAYFASITNLYTVICILAADFSVFPRYFLKTDISGYGLMDAGVGLFVVINGMSFNKRKNQSYSTEFSGKSWLSIALLFALGCARWYALEKTKYNVVVTEYGTHWNFFLTLACLLLINQMIFYRVRDTQYILSLLFIILSTYQYFLTTGLEKWIASDVPRDTFFTANREGILSLAGYETLFLFGVVISRELEKKDWLRKHAIILVSVSILTIGAQYTVGISRRMANLGYVFWIMSLSTASLIMSCIMEVMARLVAPPGIPIIFLAIHKNGLAFFLLGNLLTGLVNFCFDTLLFNAAQSVLILCCYTFICCATVCYCHGAGIRLFP